MADKIDRLRIHYTIRIVGLPQIEANYQPLTADGREVWGGFQAFLPLDGEPALKSRCEALVRAVTSFVAEREVDIDGTVTRLSPKLALLTVWPDRLSGHFFWGHADVSVDRLTAAQRRLVDSISATVERMAWEHLRRQVGAPPPAARAQVFISYRRGHEKLAEALARRLGQEAIVPWFDKWDILAGDSVPGKIEEGLRESMAFIPIITGDFQEGRWATDELHAAIVKRLEQDYKIIPVLLEHCERPDLIAHLRYVDMSKQDPETFEAKFAELVDAIYGLELNPFR